MIPTKKKPSTNYFESGVVGLGIVAAMGVSSTRSEPIQIVFTKPLPLPLPLVKEENMELSESYTCVISHVVGNNGNSIKKREYFDDGGVCKSTAATVLFFTSTPNKTEQVAPTLLFQTGDFLSFCFLCRKKLSGLDIFMYRGDKAFCSTECRCKQILSDERRAKCGSGAMMSFDYSASPCSAPRIFSAGVASA